MTNSLLKTADVPDFTAFNNCEISSAIDQVLNDANETLKTAVERSKNDMSWTAFVAPIEVSLNNINNVWSTVSHLNSVANTPELRDIYEANQQKLTDFYTQLGQNKDLYLAYQKLEKSDVFTGLSQAQKKTVTNEIRDFVLSGVSLEGKEAQRYASIQKELTQLTTDFSNKVLDATQAWTLHLADKVELDGAPDFIIDDAAQRAKDKGVDGYILTLDLPVYFTVMSQVKSEAVREKMYEAFATRASNEGPDTGNFNNDEAIEKILSLRQELAVLLGFNNYSEYSLAPKMADTPKQVISFLEDLANRAKPQAEQELKELREFAKTDFGIDELNAWDIPYYSDQMKLKLHNISQELLRPYFPTDRVLEGLFVLVKKIYGIDVEESKTTLWHDSVRFFNITKGGKKVASFYMDLYAREGKRGGAWMADCRVKMQKDDSDQLPVAFLVCNFSAAAEGKKAQLTHSEVTTLFHEFGHGLHHMLTVIDTAGVSGINGVAWDAVELPSQFMENFCWEKEVLAFISGHVETGEPLPEELLNNMLAAKSFQSAMMTIRQIEFSLFDMRIHMDAVCAGENTALNVQKILDNVREQVSVWSPPAYNRFQNSFTHIFAGGYAAGYYSYKWAELLSADVFSMFEEEGLLNKVTGEKFLNEILSKGGSEDAAILFERFRGRPPKIDALLRHSGIAA